MHLDSAKHAAIAIWLLAPFSVQAGEWRGNLVQSHANSVVTVMPQTGRSQRNLTEPEGTGVAIGTGNFIVTVDHVLAGANRVLLRKSDGSVIEAKIFLRDAASDLALLEVDELFPTVELAPVTDIGEDVCVYGNAFGLGMSLSCGIVSATDKRGIGFNHIEDFIQTDAAVNPGMSGAPLFNQAGKLAGLISAIFTKQSDGNLGVNFAASARLVSNFLKDATDGKIDRMKPGLIVQPAPLPGDTGIAAGLIKQIIPQSAEEAAGMKIGDLLLQAGPFQIRGQADYLAALALTEKGARIQLRFLRERIERTVEILIHN